MLNHRLVQVCSLHITAFLRTVLTSLISTNRSGLNCVCFFAFASIIIILFYYYCCCINYVSATMSWWNKDYQIDNSKQRSSADNNDTYTVVVRAVRRRLTDRRAWDVSDSPCGPPPVTVQRHNDTAFHGHRFLLTRPTSPQYTPQTSANSPQPVFLYEASHRELVNVKLLPMTNRFLVFHTMLHMLILSHFYPYTLHTLNIPIIWETDVTTLY